MTSPGGSTVIEEAILRVTNHDTSRFIPILHPYSASLFAPLFCTPTRTLILHPYSVHLLAPLFCIPILHPYSASLFCTPILLPYSAPLFCIQSHLFNRTYCISILDPSLTNHNSNPTPPLPLTLATLSPPHPSPHSHHLTPLPSLSPPHPPSHLSTLSNPPTPLSPATSPSNAPSKKPEPYGWTAPPPCSSRAAPWRSPSVSLRGKSKTMPSRSLSLSTAPARYIPYRPPSPPPPINPP